jgi:two-component system cell cycle sensor histidine kinase/response regulator CckA
VLNRLVFIPLLLHQRRFYQPIKAKKQIGGIMDHILVIDDEDMVLNFLRSALAYFGYSVTVAHDGEEAIELINNGYNFDLVITDIMMPRMNGNAVAKHIRSSDKSETPIVAITGYGDDIDRELFNFVLLKPFDLEALADVVRSFT